MRITKISVKGLFGMFDHEIPLNQDERITIIHGPNGVGKTVLMRMVHGLFRYEYEFLGITPFDELYVEFQENKLLSLLKDDQDNLLINFRDGMGLRYSTFECCSKPEPTALKVLIKESHPNLKYVMLPWSRVNQYWLSTNEDTRINSEVFTKEDLLQKYPSIHSSVYGEMPEWFGQLQREACPRFILTERLAKDRMDIELTAALAISDVVEDEVFPSSLSAVQDLSTKLSSRVVELHPNQVIIEDTLRKAQEFRSTLTETVEQLEEINGDKFIDEIKGELRQSISVLGDLPETVMDTPGYYPEAALEDPSIAELWDYIWGANILLDIINERFLFKDLSLNEETGLAMIGQDGSDVPFSGLSSGEQHLFILYYQLLFEIEPNTLVMIDEPELSMNVVWQRNFLKDLQRIIELRKFDVLIATHSPQIIHDKWDWMVPLGEKVDD